MLPRPDTGLAIESGKTGGRSVAMSVVLRATLRPPARHFQHTRIPTKWKSTRQSRRYPVATQGHTAPDPGTVARPGWGNSWARCPGNGAHVRRQPKSRLLPLTTVMTGVPAKRAAQSMAGETKGWMKRKGHRPEGPMPRILTLSRSQAAGVSPLAEAAASAASRASRLACSRAFERSMRRHRMIEIS